MSEWKRYKLSDIASLSNGINFDKSAYTSGVKLIGVADFKDRIYPDYNSLQEVDYKVVRKGDYLEKGDIVFVRSNGNKELVGRCMMIDQDIPITYSGFCIKLRLMDKNIFEPIFFNYLFRTRQFRKAMTGTAVGANIQNLSQSRLGNCEVCVPNIEEQREIATILSRYDSLIENYQKQIKLLEEAAQRLYKEWFVDLHFPGHENTKIVDGVPEGWEKKMVGDIVKIKSGYAFKSKDWQSTGCPVVKIKDITGTFVNSGLLDCVTFDIASKAKQYLLNSGDLVIAMTGATIGKIGIIVDNGLYTNQRVGKFFLNEEDLPFIYCFFKQESSLKQIIQLSSASSAQPNISGAQLESLSFVYNEELYDKYNLECISLFKQMISLQSQIRLLTEARDRLLPKLMSGEIAVDGGRPERPLSCQPNGNALGMEMETNNRPVGATNCQPNGNALGINER